MFIDVYNARFNDGNSFKACKFSRPVILPEVITGIK